MTEKMILRKSSLSFCGKL